MWLLLLFFCGKSVLAAEVSQEYQLKAAFLFNFARFVSWPEQAMPKGKDPINFCVIGENPFASLLSTLESKQIEGHQIQIYYDNDAPGLRQCHLAFYSDLKFSAPTAIDWSYSGQHTLNVSDIPGFVIAGGDIEFVRKQDRIEFIINNTSLKNKGLDARSSLLELATDIR